MNNVHCKYNLIIWENANVEAATLSKWFEVEKIAIMEVCKQRRIRVYIYEFGYICKKRVKRAASR